MALASVAIISVRSTVPTGVKFSRVCPIGIKYRRWLLDLLADDVRSLWNTLLLYGVLAEVTPAHIALVMLNETRGGTLPSIKQCLALHRIFCGLVVL